MAHAIAAIAHGERLVGGQTIHPLQLLQVGFQVIDKGAVQKMPAQLRQTGWWRSFQHRPGLPRCRRLAVMGHADHQYPVRAQVQCRTQWRLLTHRTIAIPRAVEQHWRKQQWDRRGGHQVIQPQPGLYADAPVSSPRCDPLAPLIEVHRLRAAVIEGADRNGSQLAGLQCLLDAAKAHARLQQTPQRPIVQQRGSRLTGRAAEQVSAAPAPGLRQQPRPIGTHHVMAAKLRPDLQHAVHCRMQIAGMGGQGQGIDRPSRGAADDRKRVRRMLRRQLGNRCHHADLIGRPGTAAGQDQGQTIILARAGLQHQSGLLRLRRLRVRSG